MHLVVTPLSIHGRLRVDGEIPHLVHFGQLLIDHARLASRGLGRPGQLGQRAFAEVGEQCANVRECRRVSPEVERVSLVDPQGNGVSIQIAISRRAGVAPSSVRKFVPFVRSRQIALHPVGPEYRSDRLPSSMWREGWSPWQRSDLLPVSFQL